MLYATKCQLQKNLTTDLGAYSKCTDIKKLYVFKTNGDISLDYGTISTPFSSTTAADYASSQSDGGGWNIGDLEPPLAITCQSGHRPDGHQLG